MRRGQLHENEIEFVTNVIVFWRPAIPVHEGTSFDWSYKVVYSRRAFDRLISQFNKMEADVNLPIHFFYQNIDVPKKLKDDRYISPAHQEHKKV